MRDYLFRFMCSKIGEIVVQCRKDHQSNSKYTDGDSIWRTHKKELQRKSKQILIIRASVDFSKTFYWILHFVINSLGSHRSYWIVNVVTTVAFTDTHYSRCYCHKDRSYKIVKHFWMKFLTRNQRLNRFNVELWRFCHHVLLRLMLLILYDF